MVGDGVGFYPNGLLNLSEAVLGDVGDVEEAVGLLVSFID